MDEKSLVEREEEREVVLEVGDAGPVVGGSMVVVAGRCRAAFAVLGEVL